MNRADEDNCKRKHNGSGNSNKRGWAETTLEKGDQLDYPKTQLKHWNPVLQILNGPQHSRNLQQFVGCTVDECSKTTVRTFFLNWS